MGHSVHVKAKGNPGITIMLEHIKPPDEMDIFHMNDQKRSIDMYLYSIHGYSHYSGQPTSQFIVFTKRTNAFHGHSILIISLLYVE